MRVWCRYDLYAFELRPFTVYTITCCAVAQSRVLRTAWVPYGNMETSTAQSSETSQVITMKLCTFD